MPEIKISQGYKKFHMVWQLIQKDQKCERYKITPRDNPDKFMIIENNRPLIRGFYRLKKRRIDWKVVEGPTINNKTLEQIIKAIEAPPAKPIKKIPLVIQPPSKRIDLHPDRPTLGEMAGIKIQETNNDK